MKIVLRERVAPPDAFRVRLGPEGAVAWTSLQGLHVDGALRARDVAAEFAWAPRGRRLAAILTGGPPPGTDLGLELFPGRVENAAAFAWSGESLIVADLAARRLVRVAPSDLAREALGAELDDAGDPHFRPRIAAAPDGRRVAYTCRPGGKGELRVADLQAGTWRTLSELPPEVAWAIPFWSPDSRRLGVFMADPVRGITGLIAVGVPDGGDEILWQSDLVAPCAEPLWAESVLFFRTDRPDHPYTRTGPARLCALDPASGRVTDLTDAGEPAGDLRREGEDTLVVDGGTNARRYDLEAGP
jgi:hypothetical protein